MRSESMCSACSAEFLDPPTRDPALYPKNYDAIRQINHRDPKHAVHLILSAVDIGIGMSFTKSVGSEAVARRNDRRSGAEADTCSGTRTGVDIELLLGSKVEVDTFAMNFE